MYLSQATTYETVTKSDGAKHVPYTEHVESIKVIADRHLTVDIDGETGGPEHLISALEDTVGVDSVTEIDPYGE